MSAYSVPDSIDIGNTVLKNRLGACPHGTSVLVGDIKTSVEGKGCAPQRGLMAIGDAQDDL